MTSTKQEKVSWVEFLRSIKFARNIAAREHTECASHFAHFVPRARAGKKKSSEESQLIRSAN